MRVVITGGTGFVGRSLVMALTERGDDVVVLSRGSRREPWRCGLGPRPTCFRGSGTVELVTWTPEKKGVWTTAVDGADAVVHLAGAGVLDENWSVARRELLRSSRIRSTELLGEAMACAAQKPRVFVSGSAIGFYGTATGGRVLTEEDPPGDDFLARLCRDWEAAAAPAREAGVRVCHPRLGLVLGPHDGVLAKMLGPFRAFVGGPVGSGEQYLGWVHLFDATRALEFAIDDDGIKGPFDVTAPEPVTMNTFARVLAKSLGRPALFRVPSFVVKAAFGDRADAILTGQRALPRRLVDAGFAFVFPELVSALADLVAIAPPSYA